MAPEYHIEGKFPGAKRVMGIGPRKEVFTHLTTVASERDPDTHNCTWRGILDITLNNIPGQLFFEKDKENTPFTSERQLLLFLRDTYHVTYLRDLSMPAVSTGG